MLFSPGAGGVVVGVGCGLGWAFGLGDIAQVDADAVPDVRSAAHAVDEDVVGGEQGGGLGMGLLPAFEAGECGFLVGGLRNGDERSFRDSLGGGFAWFWCSFAHPKRR